MQSQPINFHTKNVEESLLYFNTKIDQGLTKEEAEKRLFEYGQNILMKKKKRSLLSRFFSQFADFMVIILLVSALISLIVSLIEGDTNFVDPFIILAIVVINAILGVIQETKAERSLEALQKISSPHSLVIREGSTLTIPSSELVPGDLMLLEAGTLISADARLIQTKNMKVDEASLTGESLPVEKNSLIELKTDTVLGDRKNMVYAGSILTHGRGLGIVTATGMNTEVGHIASLIQEDESPKTPLQKRLDKTGHLLGITAICICCFIFLLGYLQGRPLFDMFMISVSLGVASIPEGLSIVVTIMLSLGVQRMAKKNAIIRNLPAVETLGSATYICSDKTGTLTKNQMTITVIASISKIENLQSPFSGFLLEHAILCSNDGSDSTENAILQAGKQFGLDREKLASLHRRLYELPFDSERKMMTSVNHYKNKVRSITKGAPDFLLKKCTSLYIPETDTIQALTNSHRKKLEQMQNHLTDQALRVLGVAYRELKKLPSKVTEGTLEEDLIFIGFLGMIDPPREEAITAVSICKSAGIIPVMITGDHALTAAAIADQIGILPKTNYVTDRFHTLKRKSPKTTQASFIISGEELNKMSKTEFEDKIKQYRVFARVSPEHKVKIVKALQQQGEVVAMTGDGINDAPALKAADIGCAMGKTGTDVAKNAADMILLDDNFSTIVSAVSEGRGIYENIKKAVHFLLSCNFGEIMTILTAILLGMPSPLLAIQLLWVNLVTDALPALAFAVEPSPKGIMNQNPIKQGNSLFADGLGFRIVLEGIMIGLLSLIAYQLGGRTMAFAVLSLSQLFHAFNIRSEHSLLRINLFSNKKMIFSFLIGFILQISVISIPKLAYTFQVSPLTSSKWFLVFALSFSPILIIELQKWISDRYFRTKKK